MRVTFLVCSNPNNTYSAIDPQLVEEKKLTNLFNSAFIKEHFSQGDQIFIEEDASLKKVPNRLLPEIDFNDYSIHGIDHPEVVSRAESLREIQTLFARVDVLKGMSSFSDIQCLKEFVEANPHPELALPDTSLDMLLAYFPLSLDVAQGRFIEEIRGLQEGYMLEKLNAVDKRVQNLFVVVGPSLAHSLAAAYTGPCQIIDYQSKRAKL